MTKKNAKQYLHEVVIPVMGKSSPYFNAASIDHLLSHRNFHVKRATLNRYLYELRSDSQIYDAGRGWYSTIKQKFRLQQESISEIIENVEKQFPLLEFSCWSTQQINRFMHHLLGRFVLFVYTERDAMASMFDYLHDEGYQVYLNPTRREAEKSFVVNEKTVVIRPIVMKSPVQGHAAQIEKILVDLLIESKLLSLMDPTEFQRMSRRLVTSERIVMSELVSYSRRRKIGLEIIFGGAKSINSIIAPEWR